jgi:glucosamine 6-phosphate synthetase-like amidotransferase/phosphosugar isomerase protein
VAAYRSGKRDAGAAFWIAVRLENGHQGATWNRFKKLFFIASGSSLNIASVSGKLYQKLAKVEVVLKKSFSIS